MAKSILAKLKSKSVLGYLIPFVLLIGFFLFLIYKGDGSFSAPKDYKTSGYFYGGNGGSDLDVRTVRWHKHNGFERLVLDCYQYNGVLGDKSYVLTNNTGKYQIGREKASSLELDGELKGYRAFSASVASFSSSKLIDDIEIFPDEDEVILFTIKLKKSTPYKVFTLKSPARIVIDLKD